MIHLLLLCTKQCVCQAYQDDVMKSEYGINFFKGFDLCLNALDNRKARNHVNR